MQDSFSFRSFRTFRPLRGVCLALSRAFPRRAGRAALARAGNAHASPSEGLAGSFSVALALALLGVVIAGCEAWDDGVPPATAATASSPAGPAAPLPPEGPIPSAPGSLNADDGQTRYASGEYAIGVDTDRYDDNDPAALKDFRAPLAPYGEWTDDPTYGTVWLPSPAAVGPDFTPYVTAGHWVYDDDYVWVSDYPWGWAPFHYGRWMFLDGRGWMWIPGREYRGAWVTWSVADDYAYIGWAPMGPAFVWFGGVAVEWHGYWGPRWACVPRGDVFAPRVGARVVVGPPSIAITARMRPYAPADPRVGGPPPARLGYAPTQVPRVSGTSMVTVNRAQQFSRPSTATALGASAPAVQRVGPRPSVAVESGTSIAPRPGVAPPSVAPRTGAWATGAPRVGPSTPSMPSRAAPPSVTYAPRPSAPTPNVAPLRAPPPSFQPFHPGGGFHGGGGGHRR